VRRLIVSALAVPALFAMAGCGDDRPDEAAWEAEWDEARAIVPTADEFATGGDALCDELTGEMRERLPRLTPTPSDALDDVVAAWIEHAEGIAFDCPTGAQLDERLAELDVLTAEVDSGVGSVR
jgi:hypothetical protein